MQPYFPTGSDFTEITPKRLQVVEVEINNRPRNVLDYEAPNDLLDHLSAIGIRCSQLSTSLLIDYLSSF